MWNKKDVIENIVINNLQSFFFPTRVLQITNSSAHMSAFGPSVVPEEIHLRVVQQDAWCSGFKTNEKGIICDSSTAQCVKRTVFFTCLSASFNWPLMVSLSLRSVLMRSVVNMGGTARVSFRAFNPSPPAWR